MAVGIQESIAALIKAANDNINRKLNYKQFGGGQKIGQLLVEQSKYLGTNPYYSHPDNSSSALRRQALIEEVRKDITRNKEMWASFDAHQNALRNQAESKLSESGGQLRVDLDTSPVQTKDSVMYRNAGDGEEGTIGEASSPNRREPGLSSNLGINL